MLRWGILARDDEDNANEDQECATRNCIISSLTNPVINWISCESCEDWYNTSCIQDKSCLEDKSESEIETMKYTCEYAVRIWWYYNKLFVIENVLLVNFSKFLHSPSKLCNKKIFW